MESKRLKPEQLSAKLFETLAWARWLFGLEAYAGVADVGRTGSQAVARFGNGEVSLKLAPRGLFELERAELRVPGHARRFQFDDALLRIAILYRLQRFNPAQSDAASGCWTFGEPGSRELGVATALRSSTGYLALTLQPGTRTATVLKHADRFVSPTYFAEDVLERLDVGRVIQVDRDVVRCEDADVLLSRERHSGEETRCYVASAVRFPGQWPIPVAAFHLAAQLDFGRFVGWTPGDSVSFERGSLRLQGGSIIEVRRPPAERHLFPASQPERSPAAAASSEPASGATS